MSGIVSGVVTEAAMERANAAWGANCGPGALAAMLAMTLDEVRPHLVGFEQKGYTNPTLMLSALKSIGRPWSGGVRSDWPNYGLARVQWEGPWTAPGVPVRARYRFTHLVGVARSISNGIGIFDVNALNNASGWVRLADWEAVVVPWILEGIPRASGRWHITHAFELTRRSVP
jgi:hypothetical protein